MQAFEDTWCDAARLRQQPLSAYLDELLAESPLHLPRVAALLGLTPLAPQQLEGNWHFDALPLPDALARAVLPVRVHGTDYVVLADPYSLTLRNWCQAHPALRRAIGAMSLPGAVQAALRQAERGERAMESLDLAGEDVRSVDGVHEISLTSIARDESPIVRLVNSMLFDALHSRASDIHVESVPDGLVVKYRVDGVLQQSGRAAGADTAGQVLSRIKVLSGLDIGERRVPQDGRFKAHMQGRDVDFRVSIMPSIHGEDAVLRVLDKSQRGSVLTLDALGLTPGSIARIRALASEPYGMVLVTGPTGSGKSTTLYAALSETNTGERKIITIEDPVEYELAGVLQIPVNDKKGLTFARGLRSILRHDPDTVLVGEIRDGETAAIAVQAALTGHLVMSSVHTNTAFSVLERFLYMGVEPASFVEALQGVVAQRLVRRVCEHCARDDRPDPELAGKARLAPEQLRAGHFRKGCGCEACRSTGFHGRLALAEVLRIDDALKDALLRRESAAALRDIARRGGHVGVREIALESAAAGLTTLQEILRVIPLA